MDQLQQNPSPSLGLSSLQPEELPSVPTSWELFQQKKAREDATSVGGYAGAMWRQDSLTDGLIAHHVGQQMVPDPTYSPYGDAEWTNLTEGVWPEFHAQFGQATSGAQALYMKDRLLQKQADLTKLGDLGVAGTIGRFALGAVSPENLLLGYGGALVSRGIKAAGVASAMRGATTEVAAAAAKAGKIAEQTLAASRPGAVVGGMAASGAGNAAFEKLRQNVNFEDEDTAVMEALLIGAAFPLPFEIAGARASSRLVAAAQREHSSLKVLDRFSRGEDLTAPELRQVDSIVKAQEVVKQVEMGHITPLEAREQLDGIHGPELSDKMWVERYGDDLKARTQEILDEMFPNRVTDRTRQVFNPEGQPLALGYEPTQNRSVGAPIQVTPGGQAVPGALTKADIELAIRNAADKKFPKDPEKAAQWAIGERAASLGYRGEVATGVAKAKAAKVSKALKIDAPVEAPKAAPEPAKAATPDDPTVPPVQASVEAPAPVVPKGHTVGETVQWFNPKTEESMWGQLEAVRESDGWLMVRDEDGKLHPVHPSRLADLPPPEGFESGFRSGGSSVVAGVAGPNADPSIQTSRFSNARLDFFAVLNRSEAESARSLVFSLVKDPLQVDAKVAQGMTASEHKSQIKRTLGGAFHREVRMAAREAAQAAKVPVWKLPAFYHEFHSLTSRVTRGDTTVAHVHPVIAPMLLKASKAQAEVYAKMHQMMVQAGIKGADQVPPNAFYVNRVWNHKGIREAIEKHGHDNVVRLLASSINVPGLTGDRVKAAKFLNVVQKLEYSKVLQNVHLYAQDMGTLRTELARSNLSKSEIDLVVDAMFTAKEKAGGDAGQMPTLKYRFDIDENMSVNYPGSGVLRLTDLFENDSRVLMDSYLNSVGGHLGLAKHGILSEADFQAKIQEVIDEGVNKGLKGVDKDVNLLQDIYSNITGRPMSTQDYSNTARVASMMRGYTRSLSLGQLGLTAAFEMKQAIGLMGMRTMMQQLPAFRGMITAIRNGYFPNDELARDIENLVGFGTEMSSSYARAAEIDDGFLGQVLSRAEHGANMASHATDVMSGNASFTSLTRQLSAKMATQRLSDMATGKVTLTPKLRERLVGWGVDDDSIDILFDGLKTHSQVAPNGRVEGIDWERWSVDAPGTYEKMQTVVSRMTRDAIQDQDLGETLPFMHSTLGKVFGELKTFFLVAHAKNMLKNLSYADATAFQVWAISFIGEALAYTTQAGLNYGHDPEKLAKYTDPMTIAGAAMMRSPVSGMVPFFANAAYQTGTGGDSLPGFGPEMTSSGNGRSFIPPSVGTVQKLWAAPSTAMGLLLDNGNVTQKEGLGLYKLLPMSNMIGARNLGEILSNSLPKTETPSQ